MGFIARPNIDFKLVDNQIVLDANYVLKKSKFKKITGSRLGSVLNVGQYSSSVKTWCDMVGIYSEPLDPIYANAGNIIEPKIKDYVQESLGIKYIQYDPKKIGFDMFRDNQYFGGIPDGEPVDENDNLLYPQYPMLEIKTTSIDSFVFKTVDNLLTLQKDENGWPIVKKENEKRAKWFSSNNEIIISDEYKLQLGLYCYLRGVRKGIFAVAFLKTSDYADPNSFDINSTEVVISDYEVDLDNFKYIIDEAQQWYDKYINGHISPKLNDEELKWYHTWVEKYAKDN